MNINVDIKLDGHQIRYSEKFIHKIIVVVNRRMKTFITFSITICLN